MKLLGLIGGMSWANTIEYYRVINQMVNERLGSWNSAKLLLYSVNFEEILPLQNNNKWDKITDIISEICMKLEQAGCSALMICSNTMHKIADQVQKKISVPLINVIDETARVVRAHKIKNIGLLGTKFTMEEAFYAHKLKNNYNLNPIIPIEKDREYIHEAIYNEFAKGIFLEQTKKDFITIIKKLTERDAEGIILGCTEIPLLIKQEDVSVPLFDTLKIHIESAVDFCLNK
ncbi:MAG: aspartate/glutamate racemase family protein [Spirochaetota bacterium]|nr:MAG: aspartate/glutamate racemase family protein [Spirochaetota bacterium]